MNKINQLKQNWMLQDTTARHAASVIKPKINYKALAKKGNFDKELIDKIQKQKFMNSLNSFDDFFKSFSGIQILKDEVELTKFLKNNSIMIATVRAS